MIRFSFLLLPALCFALGSCDKDPAASGGDGTAPAQLEGETGCLGDCTEEEEAQVVSETALNKADPKGEYGAGITLTDYTKISELLAKPEEFVGKRVLVRGEVVGVCKKRGCFVELKGDEPFQSIRFKVEDGVIIFPASCTGHEVIGEGVFAKLEFPVEKHREILASRAKAKGEEFDPETVTQPLVVWQIDGLGAKIES